jgi:hypothetical protein
MEVGSEGPFPFSGRVTYWDISTEQSGIRYAEEHTRPSTEVTRMLIGPILSDHVVYVVVLT